MPHIHEKEDFVVEVFVVYGNKVLLRKHDKYGIWLSVGGHIELNEEPNEAAVREVKEEVGLDVELYDTRTFTYEVDGFKELIPPNALNHHNISDTHRHISMIYFARASSDHVIPEKETDEWKWCVEDEIEQLPGVRPDIVHYAKAALKTLG